jgi:hypothetical protein
MSGFNQRNGLKRSGKRKATHGTAIVSKARCPKCGSRHVVACQAANATHELMCGQCSHFFDRDPEGTYRDGINVLRCNTCLGEVRFVQSGAASSSRLACKCSQNLSLKDTTAEGPACLVTE